VAQAHPHQQRLGSLRTAEERPGHTEETSGNWLRRASEHAEAVMAVLTQDLHLSTGDMDGLWLCVQTNMANQTKPTQERVGDAVCTIDPAVSSRPVPQDGSAMTSWNEQGRSPSHAHRTVH
jgi:hypothetical protein